MLISGGRTLYTRRGAHRCGVFHHYTIPAGALGRCNAELALSEVTEEDAGLALRIYRIESMAISL